MYLLFTCCIGFTFYNNKKYLYYCILISIISKIYQFHTATLSNTFVNPKYPNPKRELTKTSPLIL